MFISHTALRCHFQQKPHWRSTISDKVSLWIFSDSISRTPHFFQAPQSVMTDLWSGSLRPVGGLILHQKSCTSVQPKSNRCVSFPGSLLGGEPQSWLRDQWREGLSRRQAQVAVALIGYRLALNRAWVEELCCHGDSTICDCTERLSRTRLARSLSVSVTLILIHPADAGQHQHGERWMAWKNVCVSVCEEGDPQNKRELPKSTHKRVSSSNWKGTHLFV